MSEGKIIDKTDTGLEIILNSKYIDDMNNKEICSVIKNAKEKGDVGVRTEYSSSKIMWKYRGMLKHRDCFGV